MYDTVFLSHVSEKCLSLAPDKKIEQVEGIEAEWNSEEWFKSVHMWFNDFWRISQSTMNNRALF